MKKKILSIAVAMGLSLGAWAQGGKLDDSMNPLITAMPSTSIAPDARAAGMGDLGVATTGDMNSQYWNVAKYAMMDKVRGGITANYTPWLRKLVTDIDLAYIAGFYNISERAGAVSASLTYFSMGDVTLTGPDSETSLGTARPYEFALDVAYSRKLHEYVSMGVGLRFLFSDLTNGYNNSTSGNSGEMKPGWTMAADVDLFYHQPIDIAMGTSYFNLGFALKNMGGKVTYDEMTKNFIPTTASLGVGYELPFDNYNKLTFNLQADKMMVPTRKSKFTTAETALHPEKFNDPEYTGDDKYTMSQQAYSDLNPVKGFFQSLCDAPGGAKEEFNEVRWAAGLEYTYNRQFFARAGYSHENYYKGNRNYLTFGAGFHLSIVMLDVSYCVGLKAGNPLDQTMRFTLGFDLAGIQDLVNNRK